jgi:hypothetical protein
MRAARAVGLDPLTDPTGQNDPKVERCGSLSRRVGA